MCARSLTFGFVLLVFGCGLAYWPAAAAPADKPKGVEVLARGPVHEAFASLTADPVAPKPVPKKPPELIEEIPPTEKPEGDVLWISGYWAWDEDRSDYIWVSGVWRTPPPKKQWVAGYWREEGESSWQWVAGFWTAAPDKSAATKADAPAQEVTYLPSPPKTPAVAPPGTAPTPESFYVPGNYVWTGRDYAWRAGYWARVQPGYVWVPDHFRWTPSGYVYIPGYWDLAVSKRGILYAPVYIPPTIVVGYQYTPAYAVRDTIVVDALFVRPSTCHYYFGDYYEVRYRDMGYESCVVYSQRRYDSIVVYERYERRSDPTWLSVQVNLYNDRCSGVAPCPPRTVVQNTYVDNRTFVNNTVNNTSVSNTSVSNTSVTNTAVNNTAVNNTTNNLSMVAPTSQVAAAKSARMVPIDNATRIQARQQAMAVQQVGAQRSQTELPTPPGAPRQARVASLTVPRTESVRPGMVAPKPALPMSSAPRARMDNPSGTALPNTASRNPSTSLPNTSAHPASGLPGNSVSPTTPKVPSGSAGSGLHPGSTPNASPSSSASPLTSAPSTGGKAPVPGLAPRVGTPTPAPSAPPSYPTVPPGGNPKPVPRPPQPGQLGAPPLSRPTPPRPTPPPPRRPPPRDGDKSKG